MIFWIVFGTYTDRAHSMIRVSPDRLRMAHNIGILCAGVPNPSAKWRSVISLAGRRSQAVSFFEKISRANGHFFSRSARSPCGRAGAPSAGAKNRFCRGEKTPQSGKIHCWFFWSSSVLAVPSRKSEKWVVNMHKFKHFNRQSSGNDSMMVTFHYKRTIAVALPINYGEYQPWKWRQLAYDAIDRSKNNGPSLRRSVCDILLHDPREL